MKNETNPNHCQVVTALNTFVGKWKPIILLHLFVDGTLRFNELRRRIPDVTQRMLTLQLRELEEQDLITRVVYAQVPPKVEYSLTKYGETLGPLMIALNEWGGNHLKHLENRKSSILLGDLNS
ncbi:winged helix-turn-helix transcriptional regulator [Solibacillus sp. FSL K6-1523]|uniref:winged helix-turn-helix transcriptional regulator n=1 Tax=Solibacillus sp. FSL K6-1523 TaxID=2921471 RepID=UPI0030F793F8